MQKVVFFIPSVTHFFIQQLTEGFQLALRKPENSACAKTCFSFKIKDQIILFELAGILKNNLRLFKLDSKTLLVCHSAAVTKYEGYPNFNSFRRYFNKNY